VMCRPLPQAKTDPVIGPGVSQPAKEAPLMALNASPVTERKSESGPLQASRTPLGSLKMISSSDRTTWDDWTGPRPQAVVAVKLGRDR